MSYTIGLKRKFWFGYRKVRVKGHDWQNGRFILNLDDDTQEHIPGYAAPALKVYADFWIHLAQVERNAPRVTPQAPQPVIRQGASVTAESQPQVQQAPQFYQEPDVIPQDPLFKRAQELATQRVNSILASSGSGPGLASRSPLS